MAAKWQRVWIDIPEGYKPTARLAIGQEIIDEIVRRSRQDNKDKNGDPFPKYTKGYINSLDFKIAGKSPSRVDVTLSGETLDSIRILNHKKGAIQIGFQRGTDANAKADGNIRGTYGKSTPDSSKARDFLGIPEPDRDKILSNYPLDDLETLRDRVARVKVTAI